MNNIFDKQNILKNVELKFKITFSVTLGSSIRYHQRMLIEKIVNQMPTSVVKGIKTTITRLKLDLGIVC